MSEFTKSIGALVTVSTAPAAFETESVIWVTSSRIWSTRMSSKFAASTVSDRRSTSGSTRPTAGLASSAISFTRVSSGSIWSVTRASTWAMRGSTWAVIFSTFCSVGMSSLWASSMVERVERMVSANSTTNHTSTAPTST